jgi:predicted amidophosphoribosyltransferase
MRRIIIDFMKFDSELDRKIFNALNNGRVLLIDDIYTGGSTFTEMTRIIQVSNPENITGFILLLSQ